MAIALNVTVAGIASALLLKVEYYFLDESVSDLFHLINRLALARPSCLNVAVVPPQRRPPID